MQRKISQSALTRGSAIFLVAYGCATAGVVDPGPGKRIETTMTQASFLAGQTVTVSVKNLSDLTLSYPYHFCKTELQRQDSADWVTVFAPEGCVFVIQYLGGRQVVVQDFSLPASLQPGTYRLSMPLPIAKGETDGDRFYSPTFMVGADALNQ